MLSLILLSGLLLQSVLSLDVNSVDSIKSVASAIANGMVQYYPGAKEGFAPGVLPKPYYWWEGGAMVDTLIDYSHYTGDSKYNDLVTQALLAQKGNNNDFMPVNQTKSEGNDDQAIWALASMSAAEINLPTPASNTSWISLAQAVFDSQVARWDTQTCGGGLRWQIFAFNNGYNYKNSASNGAFFQLASRLARFTNNATYSDWAGKVYDWSISVGLIDKYWNVYDGADVSLNCSQPNGLQYSLPITTYISGVAHMYNVTNGSPKWKTALDGLLGSCLATFFPYGDTAAEVSCEPSKCNTDLEAYKSAAARWLASTIQMAPYTSSLILPKLETSAHAAAKTCGNDGSGCGLVWTSGISNQSTGLGEQMDALAFVQSLLVDRSSAPLTAGGSSNTTSSPSNTGSASTTSATSKPSSAMRSSSGAVSLCMSFAVLGLFMFLAI